MSSSDLSAQEQSAILQLPSSTIRFREHQELVIPGAPMRTAHIVADGVVGRFDQGADGSRQYIAIHIAGDMCGLDSVVWPMAGWGLEALSDTTVLLVSSSDLRALATNYPRIAMAFWRDTMADAAVLAKWASNLGYRDARSRLAHFLCELGYRMERAGIGTSNRFPLRMTQAKLADTLGLTAVHVNRMMQSLRKDRVIQTIGQEVRVHEPARLASIADFDPAYLANCSQGTAAPKDGPLESEIRV